MGTGQQSLQRQDVREVVLWLQAKPLHFRGKEIRVENGRDSGFRGGRIPLGMEQEIKREAGETYEK